MATVSIYFDTRYESASSKKSKLYYRVNLSGSRNINVKTGLFVPAGW